MEEVGFVFSVGPQRFCWEPQRCKRSVVKMATGVPPHGSKARRRQWKERQLEKRVNERENEIQMDADVFGEQWDGSDDVARQKFYYYQALREEKREKFQRAMALLEKCIALKPADTYSWMAMTRVVKMIDPLGVQDVFERAIEACPTSVHLHHSFAVYLHRIGNIERAREMFARGYEIEPGNCYVSQSWGLLEQELGNATRARELFQKAVTDNPNTEVCVALAKLEGDEGNLEQARQKFELAIEVQRSATSESDAYRAWGIVEERFGNLERAEKLLQLSYKAKPNEETIVVLSKVKMRNGDAPGSLRLIRSIERPKKAWPSVAAMNVWAGLEAKAGNFEEAIAVIKLALERYTKDSGLYLSWGTIEEKRSNVDLAADMYRKSIGVQPNAPAYVALASVEEKRSNFDKAREALEAAISTNPKHASAYNALGLLEMRTGNISKAEEMLNKGLSEMPSAAVLHGSALLDLQLGRIESARDKLERGVRLTREDTSRLWHSLGNLELRRGNVKAARTIFEEAAKRYPQSSVILLGLALSVAGTLPVGPAQDKEVRALFQKAVAVDKYHPYAWQCWGVYELRQGNAAMASKLFKTGLSHNKNHGALWQAWGVLETHNGNIFSARSIFERGNSLCPKHVHLLQAWACMEVRARNIERARELLHEALSVDPTSGPCYCALAVLEARHGDMNTAYQVFSKGLTMAPKHPPLYRTFAETQIQRRNFDAARQLFEEGLKVDPTYAPLIHAYAELEGLLGNLDALNKLQKRLISPQPQKSTDEDTLIEDKSSFARYIRMEEPLGDFEVKTFMEVSVELEQKRAEEEKAKREERRRRAKIFSSMAATLDDKIGEDEDGDEDDNEEDDEDNEEDGDGDEDDDDEYEDVEDDDDEDAHENLANYGDSDDHDDWEQDDVNF